MGKELLRYEIRSREKGNRCYFEIVEVFKIYYGNLWETRDGDVVAEADTFEQACKSQDEWNKTL